MSDKINEALALQKLGKIPEALAIYQALGGNNPDVHHLIGVCLKSLDRIDEAIASVQKALKVKRSPIYLNTLAACMIQNQSYERALDLLKEALKEAPGYIDALINIATTYRALDEYSLALEHAKQANRLDRTRWEPVDICASIAIDKRSYKVALGLIKAVIGRPEAKKVIGKLFATAAKADEYQIIENNYERLKNRLTWREQFTVDLSVAAMESNRCNFDRARMYVNSALDLFANNEEEANPNGRFNAAMTLATIESRSGNLARAIELYDEVLYFDPNSITARWNKSLLLLAKGNLSEGWSLYETRWIWKEFPSARRKFTVPRWTGEKTGKVLIWGEQGVGDQIIFMSVVNDLIENNIDFDLEINKKLVPVACEIFGQDRVREPGPEDCRELEGYMKYDFQIPLGSLCGIYRSHSEQFNTKIRRIRKSVSRRERLLGEFKQKFGWVPQKLVGLCWRSSNLLGSRKDFYLTDEQIGRAAKVLAGKGVGFISLQYDGKPEEYERLERLGVHLLVPEQIDQFNDILGTIHISGACDLIISAGTMVVYVGGLSGTPVVTWGFNDDFSLCGFKTFPWYPNINTIMMTRPPNKDKLISALPAIATKLMSAETLA